MANFIKKLKIEKSDSFTFVITDNKIDRHGEIVDVKTFKWDEFENNPVVIMQHNDKTVPVGVAKNIRLDEDRILADIEFNDIVTGENGFSAGQMAKQMVEKGQMNAVSIGFEAEQDGKVLKNGNLLEISLVTIPANPRATRVKKYKELKIEDKQMEIMELLASLEEWVATIKTQIEGTEEDVASVEEPVNNEEPEEAAVSGEDSEGTASKAVNGGEGGEGEAVVEGQEDTFDEEIKEDVEDEDEIEIFDNPKTLQDLNELFESDMTIEELKEFFDKM